MVPVFVSIGDAAVHGFHVFWVVRLGNAFLFCNVRLGSELDIYSFLIMGDATDIM